MDYGYVRVSTKEQNEQRQMIALDQCGVSKQNIFIDKQSGKDFNRVNYQKMMRKIRKGDTIFIKSIDRLGRNYDEILVEWRKITKDKECNIVVLDMPLLDTRGSKDLTSTLIADIVLQLLSYVAETERMFIKQRQAEGISAAQMQGVKFGRRPMPRPDNYEEIKKVWESGALSARGAAKALGVSHKTFLSWVRQR